MVKIIQWVIDIAIYCLLVSMAVITSDNTMGGLIFATLVLFAIKNIGLENNKNK